MHHDRWGHALPGPQLPASGQKIRLRRSQPGLTKPFSFLWPPRTFARGDKSATTPAVGRFPRRARERLLAASPSHRRTRTPERGAHRADRPSSVYLSASLRRRDETEAGRRPLPTFVSPAPHLPPQESKGTPRLIKHPPDGRIG